ncbi:MAG TPA: rhomboid family intramembrane serine protease [Polyangiales bacterium]|nr:rhomboid family intramembrane serine protease [Polyangiales bacterium]
MIQPSFEAPRPVTDPPPPVAEPPRTACVRTARDPRQLDAWALVLTSKGVPAFVRFTDVSFELHVPFALGASAQAELDAADAEDRERAAHVELPPAPVSKHAVLGAMLVAAALVAFFVVTGPRAGGATWFSVGASDAERVLHGEWWRAVTALTLHADGAHLISNLGIGSLVVGAVMRSEGVGFGAALVLASGTAGNLINAWAHQSLHRSVGFSTAVFGAIGILGGLAYIDRRRRTRNAWTALAGSIALLALLGTSEKANVDMLAHVFGAVAGLGLGLAVAWLRLRPRTTPGQWAAGLGTMGVVAAAWLVALA